MSADQTECTVTVLKRDRKTDQVIEENNTFPDLQFAIDWMEQENNKEDRKYDIASIRP